MASRWVRREYVRGEVFDDLVEFFEVAVLSVDLVCAGFIGGFAGLEVSDCRFDVLHDWSARCYSGTRCRKACRS